MKELHSEIEINASVERVWDILTDFASYPQWNPFVRSISGELKVGERLEVRLEPPDSRGILCGQRSWERFTIAEREELPRSSCTQPQPEIY